MYIAMLLVYGLQLLLFILSDCLIRVFWLIKLYVSLFL